MYTQNLVARLLSDNDVRRKLALRIINYYAPQITQIAENYANSILVDGMNVLRNKQINNAFNLKVGTFDPGTGQISGEQQLFIILQERMNELLRNISSLHNLYIIVWPTIPPILPGIYWQGNVLHFHVPGSFKEMDDVVLLLLGAYLYDNQYIVSLMTGDNYEWAAEYFKIPTIKLSHCGEHGHTISYDSTFIPGIF